jgi:heptaprenyl diphosphate synthase
MKGEGALQRQKLRRMTLSALLCAVALMLSYIEALLPFDFGIPGMKLGLANLATVLLLYLLGIPYAALVSLARILLSSFLFGNPVSLLYSLAGGVFSFVGMMLLKRIPAMGIPGVSVAGGVLHNVGQILIACLTFKTLRLSYYLPVLTVTGIITGLLIGILAKTLLPYLKKFSPDKKS